jgi:hypothetical protein
MLGRYLNRRPLRMLRLDVVRAVEEQSRRRIPWDVLVEILRLDRGSGLPQAMAIKEVLAGRQRRVLVERDRG